MTLAREIFDLALLLRIWRASSASTAISLECQCYNLVRFLCFALKQNMLFSVVVRCLRRDCVLSHWDWYGRKLLLAAVVVICERFAMSNRLPSLL